MKAIGFDFDYSKLPQGRLHDVFKRLHEISNRHPDTMVPVNGLPIPFRKQYKKIGVDVSGGADSAMLLYMLARTIYELGLSTRIVPLCVSRFWETSEHIEKAKTAVIDYVSARYPGIIETPQWGFLPTAYERTPIESLKFSPAELEFYSKDPISHSADVHYFKMFHYWAARRLRLEAVYEGTTTNPSSQIREAPSFRSPEKKTPSNIKRPIPSQIFSGIQFDLYSPFEYVEKDWVTAQFHNFGIDDLFALTKSCENSADGCQACFHCDERAWSVANSAKYSLETPSAVRKGPLNFLRELF